MGQLKEQLFLQHLNQSLGEVRNRFRSRHAAKKKDRFMVKGVTYEIGPCRTEGEEYLFEISSKIPQEMLPEKVKKERFFNEVLKLMKKGSKKPTGSRMENIVSATEEEELKERDYVNLTYRFREQELYTGEMVTKRLKQHQDKGTPIPNIPGVATPAGRVVMVLVEESIGEAVTHALNELIAANEKTVIALGGVSLDPPFGGKRNRRRGRAPLRRSPRKRNRWAKSLRRKSRRPKRLSPRNQRSRNRPLKIRSPRSRRKRRLKRNNRRSSARRR